MNAEELYAALPVPVQNLACTWIGYSRSRQRYTPYFHRKLAEWEQNLAATDAELREIQWDRLKWLIRHSREHVPYYRALPSPIEANEPTEAIHQTLARISTLTKSTYREHDHEFLATNIPRSRLISGKTSGTTGSALKLWWTPEALAEEFATCWRGRRAFGARLDDPSLTFNAQTIVPIEQRQPPFWRTNYWNHQTLFSIYHCSPDNLESYVEAIHTSPARYVQGYPSFLHLVARAMLDMGRPLPQGRINACFTSSESLLAFQRDTVEKAFGAPIHDRYGVSEFCVSMTQCHAGLLHVDMEFCIVEVEAEEETNEWVRGPLIVTGLANEATPLVRYRVGDIGTRSKRPCICGRAGDAFLDVDGRVEDYAVLPDGTMVGRLDHIFKAQLDVAEAQILQETPEALDVLVVPRRSYDEHSERNLLKEFRSRVGDAIVINLRYVDSIPREQNGKFRAVKSKVGRLNP